MCNLKTSFYAVSVMRRNTVINCICTFHITRSSCYYVFVKDLGSNDCYIFTALSLSVVTRKIIRTKPYSSVFISAALSGPLNFCEPWILV